VTPGDYVDWRENNEVFDTLSGYAYRAYGLTEPVGSSVDAELLSVVVTSSDFFRTLAVQPFLGRTFLPEEDQPGRDQVAVLSHGLWTRRFGSDRGILGREIMLEGRPHTVIGVMPVDFDYPVGQCDLWTPRVLSPEQRDDRQRRNTMTVGRLRPGVTLRQARAELQALAARLAETHPQTNTGRGVQVLGLRYQQSEITGPFLAFGQLSALLVLFIACANVSNLQLVRSTSKRKETTIRVALGAGRWRVGRLVVIESLLLSLAGSGIGIAIAVWGVGVLKDSVSPEMARFVLGFRQITVDWTVLAFSLAVAAAIGVAFGLTGAFETWRYALMDGLREASQTGVVRRVFLRRILVAAEVALAVVITVSAGQMIQGFQSLFSSYRGFSPEEVATLRIRLHGERYDDPWQVRAFQNDLLASVSAVPGVESAALVSTLPAGLVRSPSIGFRIEGRPEPGPGEAPLADLQIASEGYFRTVRIPLLDGRTFDHRDDPDVAPDFTVVISERLARQYWPDENPIGKRLRPVTPGETWRRVIGVVGDVRQNWFEVERPLMYLPATQYGNRQMHLTVRGSGTIDRLLSITTRQLRRLDPSVPVFAPKPLNAAVEESVAGIREAAGVMGVFGSLALLLSTIGVYGLMAYSVKQREREFGIRMALGAMPSVVLRMVARQGLAVAVVGLCVGVPIAVAMTRLWASFLFGTSADSTATTIMVSGLVTTAVLLACYLPARSATRVSPMRSLRCE
jgi:putative ABC transport system permease protein